MTEEQENAWVNALEEERRGYEGRKNVAAAQLKTAVDIVERARAQETVDTMAERITRVDAALAKYTPKPAAKKPRAKKTAPKATTTKPGKNPAGAAKQGKRQGPLGVL